MIKRFFSALSLFALSLMTFSCYDDSDLWESVNDLNSRVQTLESMCSAMNTNISSVQSLVASIQSGAYITSVNPLTENGVEVGYMVTLSDGQNLTIYHGKDGADGVNGTNGENGADGENGKDGNTPKIGVKQDTDGKYYWVADGEWLTDKDGKKMPVTSEPGKDGMTPQVKVENGKWYVSYDNGKTWNDLGEAVVGSSCLFKEVTYVNGILTLTFTDGNSITLSVGGNMKIVLGEYDPAWGNKLDIPYAVEGAIGEVMVFATTDLIGGDHEICVKEIIEETSTTGVIKVDVGWWDEKEYNGKLAIFAVDETGKTVSKIVRLATGVLYESDEDSEYVLNAEASELAIKVITNRTLKSSAQVDWITPVETKTVDEKTLLFDVKANDGAYRKGEILIMSGDRQLTFTVHQRATSKEHVFYANVTWDEMSAGNYVYVYLMDTWSQQILNASGRTVMDVLGYESWEELKAAIGLLETAENFAGEVVITAYDVETGESFGKINYNSYTPSYYFNEKGNICDDRYASKVAFEWHPTRNSVDGEYLEPYFTVRLVSEYDGNGFKLHVGESCTFGILLASENAEARIEVTCTMDKYEDPEVGMYMNPAEPGRYEFELYDEVNINTSESRIRNREVYEIVKKTLGMTAYEIYKEEDNVTRYFVFSDVKNDAWPTYYLDMDGNVVESSDQEAVFYVRNVNSGYPTSSRLEISICQDENTWCPAVIQAAEQNRTIEYVFVLEYKDYELIFNHKVKFTMAE